jgi:hypothetical protein
LLFVIVFIEVLLLLLLICREDVICCPGDYYDCGTPAFPAICLYPLNIVLNRLILALEGLPFSSCCNLLSTVIVD